MLSDTLGLSIVGWISDAEVLILHNTVPGGRERAIEVFNVETRKVRRLAEGGFFWKANLEFSRKSHCISAL